MLGRERELGVGGGTMMANAAGTRAADGSDISARPRDRSYVTLEGMRGLGAIAVVLYHYLPNTPLPGTYLAVDMFFLMSGIVLGERYHGDLESGRLGVLRFCVMRAIRILPLYWLGMVLGIAIVALGMMLGDGADHNFTKFVLSTIPTFAMIPNMSGSIWLFPLNIPAWSLFYELAANIAFALFAPYRSRTLIMLMIVGGAAVLAGGLINQTLDIGSRRPDVIWGVARVTYSFFCGVLIARMKSRNWLPWLRLPSWLMVLIFAGTLLLPYKGPVAALLAPAIVLLFYPVMMYVARRTEPGARLGLVMQSVGGASFALYAIHVPLMMAFAKVATMLGLPMEPAMLASVPIALGLAYVALYFYDIPVRRWLTAQSKRWFAARPDALPRTA